MPRCVPADVQPPGDTAMRCYGLALPVKCAGVHCWCGQHTRSAAACWLPRVVHPRIVQNTCLLPGHAPLACRCCLRRHWRALQQLWPRATLSLTLSCAWAACYSTRYASGEPQPTGAAAWAAVLVMGACNVSGCKKLLLLLVEQERAVLREWLRTHISAAGPVKQPPPVVRLRQVGGDAHTTWLRDALAAAGIKAPVLGGIPKVCCVLTVHVASRSRKQWH